MECDNDSLLSTEKNRWRYSAEPSKRNNQERPQSVWYSEVKNLMAWVERSSSNRRWERQSSIGLRGRCSQNWSLCQREESTRTETCGRRCCQIATRLFLMFGMMGSGKASGVNLYEVYSMAWHRSVTMCSKTWRLYSWVGHGIGIDYCHAEQTAEEFYSL